jgi:hypothetical protein
LRSAASEALDEAEEMDDERELAGDMIPGGVGQMLRVLRGGQE